MKIIFYLSLFISSILPAQVPGYIGKRFFIGVNFEIGFPNASLPSNYKSLPAAIYDDYYSYYINFPKCLNLKAGYVITEKRALELSFRNMNLGIQQIFINKNFPSSSFNTGFAYTVMNIHYSSFGISVKQTLNGSISPLGKYLLIGITYNRAKITDPNLEYQKYGVSYVPFKTGFIDLHLGMGVNMIFQDKFIFNMAFDSYINNYILSHNAGGDPSAPNHNDLVTKKAVEGRMFSGNIFMASVGVGYLIF